MLKNLLISSLAAGALALGAPAAHASHEFADCTFDTASQSTVTGGQDTYTGAIYGYVVSTEPAERVEVVCSIRIDGAFARGVSDGPGIQADTFGPAQVTYTASDTQDVDLCVEWYTETHGWQIRCEETTTTQIPPQEVIDLITDVTSIPDGVLCPILASLSPGVPGVVDIDAEGDVEIAGIPLWDCPPYGS